MNKVQEVTEVTRVKKVHLDHVEEMANLVRPETQGLLDHLAHPDLAETLLLR